MILGHKEHHYSACFDEIDEAVSNLTNKLVCFNAHVFEAPREAIIYNLENIPPIDPIIFTGHETWDFSKRNSDRYGFKYVPIGYHPSMEKFNPVPEKQYDIAFFGIVNDRRRAVLDELQSRGLKICVSAGIFGKWRNSLLARSRLALSMLYYKDGTFPALRLANCMANRIPILSERCPEDDSWQNSGLKFCEYHDYIDTVFQLLESKNELNERTEKAYEWFKQHPLTLPSSD